MSMPQSDGGNEISPIDFSTGAMHYFAAYAYVFQSPNWFLNLLYGLICNFIPVVGPIVLLGYKYEVVEALHRQPSRVYPDFDFGRFGDYLLRGVWPFLATLLVMFPIWLVFAVPMFFFQILLMPGGHHQAEPLAVAAFASIGVFGTLIASVLMLLIFPLNLRAGLTQDFVQAFDFAFILDFVKKMWLDMILSGLFLWISAMVLLILGFLFCCVGAFFTQTLVTLATSHLIYQLYELYLQRGGQPIPLKTGPLPAES